MPWHRMLQRTVNRIRMLDLIPGLYPRVRDVKLPVMQVIVLMLQIPIQGLVDQGLQEVTLTIRIVVLVENATAI